LEFFENNFTAEYFKAYARADPNMGDLVQQKYPGQIKLGWKRGGVRCTKNLQYPETVQDRTKVTMTVISKVIEVGTNRKRVCDFLLVRHSWIHLDKQWTVLSRTVSEIIAGFMCS